jgi:hypothetical protein
MQYIFAILIVIKPPLAKVVKYPDVDFIESTSPIIYTYLYQSNTSLPFLKHKLKLKVSLRYMSIHFTVN